MKNVLHDGVSLALIGVIIVATLALFSRNDIFRTAAATWFVAP